MNETQTSRWDQDIQKPQSWNESANSVEKSQLMNNGQPKVYNEGNNHSFELRLLNKQLILVSQHNTEYKLTQLIIILKNYV